ncbi:MAG: S8 family serine peptidase [Desulfobulbaceae bacterium]|nr:S8 family serine peptidase [Desulfobulbaceae bacterium]
MINNKAAGILVFFLCMTLLHPCAQSKNGKITDLQPFVDSGKLQPGILTQLEEAGEIEILLHFEESDIRNFANKRMRDQSLKFEDRKILNEKARRYAGRKHLVFSKLSAADFQIKNDYTFLPVVHMAVTSQILTQLLAMDEVFFVGENRVLFPLLADSLDLIDAPVVHGNGLTGTGTTVAVLDTGIDYTHAAFGSCTSPNTPASCRVAYAQDVAPEDYSLDSTGHGTNVSGIVAGVAPGAKIIGLDVFDGNSAWYSDIISAINWVLTNRDLYNIVAVNMSIGDGNSYSSPCPADELAGSITALKKAGITTVVSAGNEGNTSGLSSPACAPDALSVGAVYDANVGGITYSGCSDSSSAADKVTCFSNSASFLSLLAPGSLITAAGSTKAGTSQAAPHAAGAVAVLKELDSLFSVDDIFSQLTGTGVPVTDPRNSITTPRLDLYSAVTDLQPPSSNFTAAPLSGNAPLIVDFTDSSAWFPNSWLWDFGDGQTSSVQSPVHLYEQPGIYSVSLTAANTLGSDFFSQSFYVDVASCPLLPAMIDSFDFSTLQAAYNTAIDGDIIKSHAVIFYEDLLLDRNIEVSLSGGFNCEYSNSIPATKIIGSLTISQGTVSVDNLVIQ